jgi:hypothetical protein
MSYTTNRIDVCVEFATDIWRINLSHIPLGTAGFIEVGPNLAYVELDRTSVVVAFALLHEAGHALIDVLRLPVAGREEDAADQFAAWFAESFVETPLGGPRLTPTGISLWQMSRRAAEFFDYLGRQEGLPPSVRLTTLREMADVHGLPGQRALTLECLWRGKAAAAFAAAGVGSPGDMSVPESRTGAECLQEWVRTDRAWRRLLGAHLRQVRSPGR